jgi:DNA-binding phage protein
MNTNKLKGKMVENEITVTILAEKLGIDKSTLYRKLSNQGEKLSIKEVNEIVKILGLTKEESLAIFFKDSVASDATK